MRWRFATRLCGGVLVAAGLAQAAMATHGPVKAMVGQWLLERAWEERSDGTPARPWSWADIAAAARISVPRLGLSQVVLGSASGEAMAWGPGHVEGTARLGAPGLAAVAGHRDSHLAFLADLRPGDEIMVETADGRTHRYIAAEALVVDSTVWRFPIGGPERLALATCWPFDAGEDGPLRFVLFADPA